MDFQVWTVMTNSALLTKVTSEHKKCESQSTKVTYIRPSIYDIYNNISLIFCVVPDSVSLTANYCIYNYHGWALYVCVCVFAWLLTSFSYSTTALHFITWCQEWFSLRQLLAVLTSGMMFQPSWLEAVVLVAGPIGSLPNHSYIIVLSCVKTRVYFRERRGGGLYISLNLVCCPSPTP